MDQLHHHDHLNDEAEEADSILLVVVGVGNKLLDFLNKLVSFLVLAFHKVDFLSQHTAEKVDSKKL